MLKKFFISFIMMLSLCINNANAQYQSEMWFQSYSYSQKHYNYYTECWTDWTDWTRTKVNIKFDLNRDVITIYSQKTQYYKVISVGDAYYDASGGQQVQYSVIDGDYDRGTIRLRVERNNNLQIYVDFADIMWVYNVIRIK